MSAPASLACDDIFAPYVSMTPKVATVLGESVVDGIKVTHLRFASVEGSVEGKVKPCEYYAIMARPAAPARPAPGDPVLPRRGGLRAEDAAVGWARLGYVCISPETGRIRGYRADAQPFPRGHAEVRPAHRHGQPRPVRLHAFRRDGLGLRAHFNLLASQEDVDKSRIGITGISCGGYMVTMLSGLLDGRVKAVFNLYGSGFVQYGSVFANEVDKLTPEQKKVWIDNFDAATRLARAAEFTCCTRRLTTSSSATRASLPRTTPTAGPSTSAGARTPATRSSCRAAPARRPRRCSAKWNRPTSPACLAAIRLWRIACHNFRPCWVPLAVQRSNSRWPMAPKTPRRGFITAPPPTPRRSTWTASGRK